MPDTRIVAVSEFLGFVAGAAGREGTGGGAEDGRLAGGEGFRGVVPPPPFRAFTITTSITSTTAIPISPPHPIPIHRRILYLPFP
ncbi:MAG: hypothetical protein JOZ19_04500 [Rubrobacter sp.]|nr:hypothetical protein [Rubrobacter sp.]